MYISIQPFSIADIVARVESEFISFSKAYVISSVILFLKNEKRLLL